MDLTQDQILILLGCLAVIFPIIFVWMLFRGADIELYNVIKDYIKEKKRVKRVDTYPITIIDILEASFIFFIILSFQLANPFWTTFKLAILPIGIIVILILGQKLYISIKTKWDPFNTREKIAKQIANIIIDGEIVYASFGELGHNIFENDEIIKALEISHKENNAEIILTHGPRVDPKTKSIFKLARDNILEIIRSEKYYHNHFGLIVTKSGEKYIIDEQVHDEVFWNSTNKNPFYKNKTRIYFFYKNRQKIWDLKLAEFNKRIEGGKKIKIHPSLRTPQRMGILKTVKEFFWYNIIVGNILQPFSIITGIPIPLIYK